MENRAASAVRQPSSGSGPGGERSAITGAMSLGQLNVGAAMTTTNGSMLSGYPVEKTTTSTTVANGKTTTTTTTTSVGSTTIGGGLTGSTTLGSLAAGGNATYSKTASGNLVVEGDRVVTRNYTGNGSLKNASYTVSKTTTSGGALSTTAGATTTTTTTGGAVTVNNGTVIRREVGEPRVISVNERVDTSRTEIISERIIEHEVRVPKRVVREDLIEKVILVPEKVIREEIIDEAMMMKEKILEVAKPVIVEKVIEVPEIEYVEKIVEVPQKIIEERLVEKVVPRVEERIVQKTVVVPREKIVEVPEIRYQERLVEKVVEVEDWRDEVRVKEVKLPAQYVEVPVAPQPGDARYWKEVETYVDVERTLPVAVDATITTELRINTFKPKYHKISYPVYLPKFIEVPCALELLPAGAQQQSQQYISQINGLTKSAASLCDIESLASRIMTSNKGELSTFLTQSAGSGAAMQAILQAWNKQTLIPGSQMPYPAVPYGTTTTTTVAQQQTYTSPQTTSYTPAPLTSNADPSTFAF